MDDREATVRRGEQELMGPDVCPICSGLGRFDCVHCALDEYPLLRRHPCDACDGEGWHACNHCRGSGRIVPFEQRRSSLGFDWEEIRDVNLDGYRLTVWDTHETEGGGFARSKLAYRLRDKNGLVLFEGTDFHCGAGTAIDSDEMVRSLLSFLSLSPGDTDDDYFSKYNEYQWEFATSSESEELSLWALEPEHLSDCKRSGPAGAWECADGCVMREYCIPDWDEEDEREVVPPDSER